MWRCHCGENNLGSAAYCAECEAPRLTHEERSREPRKRESHTRNVQVGFLGLGVGRAAERKFPSAAAIRALSESEIADYYAEQKRRRLLNWLMYVAAVLAVVGLLAWQLFRRP